MQFRMGHTQKLNRDFVISGLWKIAVVLALVILILTFAVPVRASQPNIAKVDVKQFGDHVQVTISSSLPLAIHDSRLGSRYLVFDLYGRLAPGERKRVSINAGGIKSLRCCWFRSSPPIARIAIRTSGRRDYSVESEPGQRIRRINVWKVGAVARSGHTNPSHVTARVAGAIMETPVVRPVQTPAPKPVLVASAAPAVLLNAVKAPAEKLVSLDFVASDIHDVLKALAMQGGVNVVASPDVKGNVTVSLSRVTVEEALKLITNVSGFRYEQIEGSYVVGTADNLRALAAGGGAPEDKITDVVTIIYADPAAIAKMLEAQYAAITITSSSAGAKDAKGPTVLVLSGAKSSVAPAKALAETIEASFAQNVLDSVVELYEVKYAEISEISTLLMAVSPKLKVSVGPAQGFNLKCPTAVAMGSDQAASSGTAATTSSTGTGTEKAPAKTLLLQGPKAEVEKAKVLLAQLDVPQPQIMIEARVVDITDSGSSDFGILWGDKGVLDRPIFSEMRSSGDQAITIGRIDRTPFQVQATLKGLVESGKGKMLASPNVLAIDGKPASAFIGDEVKYVIRVDVTPQGTNVMTEVARVGVQLHTISRINSDGFITMNLHPEVSVITKWIDTPGGLALPEVSRRYIDSTVRVKDGETIVIGGLIKDEDIKSMAGIPFLKDLPIIGEFFKARSSKKTHSEIMMFITPRVMTQ